MQPSERHDARFQFAALALGTLLTACTARIEGDDGTTPPGAGQPGQPGSSSGAGTGTAGSGSSGAPGNNTGGTSGEPNPPTTTPPVTTLPEASTCKDPKNPGPRALRRLTAAEYEATLKDLFSDPSLPLTTVFADPSVLGFKVDTHALVIQGLGAQQLADQSESIAKWAVTSRLNSLSSCTTNDASCRQTFIRTFGKRVHRSPLTDADVSTYEKLFTAETSFAAGVEAVTAAMLQSPYFLYRRELGAPAANGFQLTPYELASSLSYMLTGSMPDAELMSAADSGSLAQPQELERHAERLLQSQRGRQVVYTFLRDWLGLGKLDTIAKDDTVFKLTDTLRKAMGEETRRVIDDTVFNQNGSFLSLLTSKSSFMNRELASHYGLDNAGSLGDAFVPVTFPANKRDSGLLAQGSLLTAMATAREGSPVQRGRMVRIRLLCQEIPPPPANVDTALKPSPSAATNREHYAQHSSDPVCASCHRLMDPIGFGFEHYDGFGRYRDQENGHPIDASGAVIMGESERPFQGLAGLTEFLTTDAADTVNACMVRYMSYFAFGAAGWPEDQCTYDAISAEAKKDDFAVRSVVKAILKTARFTTRVAD